MARLIIRTIRYKYFNNRNLWKAVLMKMVIGAKSEEEAVSMIHAITQMEE